MPPISSTVIGLKFIPERGRKLVVLCLLQAVDESKFIPERGRKPVVACIPRLADGLKFNPVRGRKLLALVKLRNRNTVEIYPREGTETKPHIAPAPL